MRSIILVVCALVLTAPALAETTRTFSFDFRTTNTSIRLERLPLETSPSFTLRRVYSDIYIGGFVIKLTEAPDDSGRVYLGHNPTGRIVWFPKANPVMDELVEFLNIADRIHFEGEMGLMDFEFDPNFAENGIFYVAYVSPESYFPGYARTSVVSRFRVDDNTTGPMVADPDSEEVVLRIPNPHWAHNVDDLMFGPNGLLYISVGDGGFNNSHNGQDFTNHLGTILRIDVSSTPVLPATYVVPLDNPFYRDDPTTPTSHGEVRDEPLAEIYAYGFRNPWRMTYDTVTSSLLVADVGEHRYEEINSVEPGGNYGWAMLEGTHCYPSGEVDCPTSGTIPPIHSYGREVGASVIGGHVYRGSRFPELYGKYIFADWVSQRLMALDWDTATTDTASSESVTTGGYTVSQIGALRDSITVFEVGSDQELILVGNSGIFYELAREEQRESDLPRKLSDYPELFEVASGRAGLTSGVIPYRPVSPLWSDHALKERYLILPDYDHAAAGQAQIDTLLSDNWRYPNGTIFVKNFLLPLDRRDLVDSARRIETRLMIRANNVWNGYSYRWDESESDATLLPAGRETRDFEIVDFDGEEQTYTWLYPSRSDCFRCHTAAANFVLGFHASQLDTEYQYDGTTGPINQLDALVCMDLLDRPDTLVYNKSMVDPMDESEPLHDRARAYLQSNCSSCHQPEGPAPTAMNFLHTARDILTIDEPVGRDDLGIEDALLIESGFPERSVLYRRLQTLEPEHRMPPLSSSVVDEAGSKLIRDWILSLRPQRKSRLATDYILGRESSADMLDLNMDDRVDVSDVTLGAREGAATLPVDDESAE